MITSPLYIVLCGMPRCGTRQFSDLLDRDDRVCLQGEITQTMLPYIHELVMAADNAYAQGRLQKPYKRKRKLVVAELFGFFSNANRMVKPGATIHGFKTPNIELYHDKISAIFLPSTDRLIYFYCIRNINDCYLSLTSMSWFGMSQEQFILRYIKSLRVAIELHEISKKAGSKIDIAALNLDGYIAAQDKVDWMMTHIYRPINIDLEMDKAIDIVTTTENRNSTENATGKKRSTVLSDDVNAVFIRHKDDINSAIVDFNETFGESLTLYGV